MSIQSLAADIASRIPAMAQDSAVNNEGVIQRMIEGELLETWRMRMPTGWQENWIRMVEAENAMLQEHGTIRDGDMIHIL